jgi:DnaJ-class molecular chaperone
MSGAHRTLGVPSTATPAEIKAAYRKLAQRYHPDVKGGDARRMARINAAYDELKNAGITSSDDMPVSGFVFHFEGSAGSVGAVMTNLASALFGGGIGEFFEEAARMKEAEQRRARQRPKAVRRKRGARNGR